MNDFFILNIHNFDYNDLFMCLFNNFFLKILTSDLPLMFFW